MHLTVSALAPVSSVVSNGRSFTVLKPEERHPRGDHHEPYKFSLNLIRQEETMPLSRDAFMRVQPYFYSGHMERAIKVIVTFALALCNFFIIWPFRSGYSHSFHVSIS